ncbi:hypothetical protein Adt_14365 [Abeliophyllum distichum]|uniref:Uncharacterized protein n=1 Tax=Abeliophyllum distichum TaxID=126358 RepID=A0ABD1U056_9LAMI
MEIYTCESWRNFISSKILGMVYLDSETLHKRDLRELAVVVGCATKNYHCPNSTYRALREVGCPKTNTFMTVEVEIGIFLGDLQDITRLSILGEYYEEIVLSLSELMDLFPSLADICLMFSH